MRYFFSLLILSQCSIPLPPFYHSAVSPLPPFYCNTYVTYFARLVICCKERCLTYILFQIVLVVTNNLSKTRIRRVWRYQRGYHYPYIEEEQTKQWSREKVQKYKQRSTKHTHKTKDRVTRTPQKPRVIIYLKID